MNSLAPNCLEYQYFPKEELYVSVTRTLLQMGCSLNVVNNYRENIVHLCASNNCKQIIEVVLRKHGTERADSKNKFGWTPLMQALRERHLETAQFLINSGFHPRHRSYLGMSTLGIAAAANLEAFDCVFERYPVAINSTATDDISPLCIAAMKNDKPMFMKILKLGVPLHTASEYTHYMMRKSVHEEIRKMAKLRLCVEDFWEDNEDDIAVSAENSTFLTSDQFNDGATDKNANVPNIQISHSAEPKNLNDVKSPVNLKHLHIDVNTPQPIEDANLFSPNLVYNQDDRFCMSPNVCFKMNSDKSKKSEDLRNDGIFLYSPQINMSDRANKNGIYKAFDFKSEIQKCSSEPSTDSSADNTPIAYHFYEPFNELAKKCEKLRKSDLKLKTYNNNNNDCDSVDDLNVTLGFSPDFVSVKSPNAPHESDDEHASGDKTPTPPRCSTPPTGIVLTSSQNELVRLLHTHHLDRHIPLLMQQEIDFDLFSTLQDVDLVDIGIESETDRAELLNVINGII